MDIVQNLVILSHHYGRARLQVVSLRRPKAAARIRARVSYCGICGGQSGSGVGFIRVLRFPCQFLFPPTPSHSSSSIVRGW
jgi:hypothetical protein